MGVTITATNTRFDFDMGYGGFFGLRKNIAIALDEAFGRVYAGLAGCWTEEDYRRHDEAAQRIINARHLDKTYADVLEFLYLPDTNGKIGYKTCRKIAELLEPQLPMLKAQSFRYAAYKGRDYEEFVQFLRECVRHHKNMCWS